MKLNRLHDPLSETFEKTVVEISLMVALVSLGFILSSLRSWWKRRKELRETLQGIDFSTLEFIQVLVDATALGPAVHFQPLGVRKLAEVFLNKFARTEFLKRARKATEDCPFFSMSGEEGNYLARTLTFSTADVVVPSGFEKQIWVLVPVVLQRSQLGLKSPAMLLVRRVDLPIFMDWKALRHATVHQSSHTTMVVTMIRVAQALQPGSSRWAEIVELVLALDTRLCVDLQFVPAIFSRLGLRITDKGLVELPLEEARVRQKA